MPPKAAGVAEGSALRKQLSGIPLGNITSLAGVGEVEAVGGILAFLVLEKKMLSRKSNLWELVYEMEILVLTRGRRTGELRPSD